MSSRTKKSDSTQRGGLEGAIFFWLQQAHFSMRNRILAAFREEDIELTPEQWTVMMSLWQRDRCSQAELAKAAGRDKPGVTRLVDALEELGLVRRDSDPEDRRRHVVVLTDKGREAHRQLLPIVQSVMDGALEGVSPSQRKLARAVLKQIRTNLRGGLDGD